MIRYLFSALMIVLLASSLSGQSDAIQQFFDKYRDAPETTNVKVGGLILDLAITFADTDEEAELLRKISRVRVMTLPEKSVVSTDDILALRQSVLADDFEELIQVRDEGDLINIYLREDAEAITDLLIMVDDGEELTCVSLEGRLQWEDLDDLDFEGTGLAERRPAGSRGKTVG